MAVEILYRLFDGTGGRKKGDIVTVKPAPHRGWGKGEGLPNYGILKIDDVDKTTIDSLYYQRHKPVKWDVMGGALETIRSWHRIDDAKLSVNDKLSLDAGDINVKFKDIASVLTDRTKEK